MDTGILSWSVCQTVTLLGEEWVLHNMEGLTAMPSLDHLL